MNEDRTVLGGEAHLVPDSAHPLDHLRDSTLVPSRSLLSNGLDSREVALQRIQRGHGRLVIAWDIRNSRGGVTSTLCCIKVSCASLAHPLCFHSP